MFCRVRSGLQETREAPAKRINKHTALRMKDKRGADQEAKFAMNCIHQAGPYPGFRWMKRLGVFLLPPWMICYPIAGLPPAVKCLTNFRTQHNVPGQDSNPDHSTRRRTR